jgi:hypothetical protein
MRDLLRLLPIFPDVPVVVDSSPKREHLAGVYVDI